MGEFLSALDEILPESHLIRLHFYEVLMCNPAQQRPNLGKYSLCFWKPLTSLLSRARRVSELLTALMALLQNDKAKQMITNIQQMFTNSSLVICVKFVF